MALGQLRPSQNLLRHQIGLEPSFTWIGRLEVVTGFLYLLLRTRRPYPTSIYSSEELNIALKAKFLPQSSCKSPDGFLNLVRRCCSIGCPEEHLLLGNRPVRAEPAAACQEGSFGDSGFEDGLFNGVMTQTLLVAWVFVPIDLNPLLNFC